MKIAIKAILFIVMMLGVAVWSGFYFYLGNRSAPAFEPLIEEEGALTSVDTTVGQAPDAPFRR